MRLLVIGSLVALAAGTAHAAPKHPPKLFAKLFHDGATWTFPAEQIDNQPGDSGTLEREVTKGEVTCTVAAHRIARAWVAELTCDGLGMANLVSGTYVATRAGLWRADDFDGDVASLDPARMLIAAHPVAGDRTFPIGGNGYQASETLRVAAEGDGWCGGLLSDGGDEGGWMLCLSKDRGVIGGNGFFAGAATHDTYFGDTPRY